MRHLSVATSVLADSRKLISEDYHIPAADPGIQLFLRNKHPEGVATFPGEKILLFVHGATYPAETAFDLPLNGLSMMDYIAYQGWDVYLVDVRGYGGSTRPPEMDKPAKDNKPIVDTLTAVKDVGAAVDHILQKRKVAKINLMGWSWGTAIMGMYTAEHNDKVNRLVLYAPLWLFNSPPIIGGDGPLGAYRMVSKNAAKQRWLNGVAEDKKADLIPPGWFEQWADVTWATDPMSAKQDPPTMRAPNGVVADLRAYWRAGKPQYDPRRHQGSNPCYPCRMGCGFAQLPGAGVFRQIDPYTVQAVRRVGRGNSHDHHGEEPDAVLPGSVELFE